MIIINRCIIIITVCDIAILQKYIDIFAGTFGFWLLGYAISGNTSEPALGEEQDSVADLGGVPGVPWNPPLGWT